MVPFLNVWFIIVFPPLLIISDEMLLVGGLEHEFHFSIQLGIAIPTDELIFFRGVETTNQYICISCIWVYYNDLITISP